MDILKPYRRAQEGLDAVLATVRPDQWDTPSTCSEWTVRDIAGHVIWGQRQLRAWATGEQYTERAGAPGAAHPAVLTGDDPLGTWRVARAEALAVLTGEALARMAPIPGIGEIPVAGVLALLTTDQLVHTWDIGHSAGLDVHLDPEVLPVAFDWARANVTPRPVFFKPALTPPAEADAQTRMLAFLGRAAWQPVPS